jgi:hypothetical protein
MWRRYGGDEWKTERRRRRKRRGEREELFQRHPSLEVRRD